MNRIIITLLCIFSLNAYSQIENGKFLISLDGNFNKSGTESGVQNNSLVSQGKYLDLGTTVGYFVTDNFIIGAGFNYVWSDEDRTSQFSNLTSFIQAETMNIKSHTYLVDVYGGYYYQICNKLYFNTNLKFSFGKTKVENKNMFVSSEIYTPGVISERGTGSICCSWDGDSDTDCFSVELLPELTYFVTPKFGLNLGLGGVGFAMADWDKDNTSWLVNFNPSYWRLGFSYCF